MILVSVLIQGRCFLTQIYIGGLTELPTLVNVYILLVHFRFPQELKNQDILLLDW